MPSQLNPRYTFPAFVVGKSNEAAYTAASAAAVAPGKVYNPILISGATGLGKTHLAHAVAAEANMRADRTATLVTADEFLREHSAALREGRPHEVVDTLANAQLLVIDDVHVLDRHGAAQDALSALTSQTVANGTQLMLTSDSAAGADALAIRLVRRFRSAHVVNLGTPDWSHRVSILHAKARSHDFDLPPSVAHHLAGQPAQSVRELEGNLTRLTAIASLEGVPLSLALARRAFPTQHRDGEQMMGPHIVQEAVAAEWGVSPDALVGDGRARAVAEPRRIGMLLCRELLSLSLREIGAAFGDRDASTVTSALQRARTDIEEEPMIAERVARIRDMLPTRNSVPTAPSRR